MEMKKCVIICNPSSGKNNKKLLIQKFLEILKAKDYETIVKYTKYSGHAKKIVKENRWQEYLEVFNKQYELSRETVYFEEIMLAGMIIGELKPENKQSNVLQM